MADRRADDLNAEPGRVREQNAAPIAAIMQLPDRIRGVQRGDTYRYTHAHLYVGTSRTDGADLKKQMPAGAPQATRRSAVDRFDLIS
jgi:hypothetical protein